MVNQWEGQGVETGSLMMCEQFLMFLLPRIYNADCRRVNSIGTSGWAERAHDEYSHAWRLSLVTRFINPYLLVKHLHSFHFAIIQAVIKIPAAYIFHVQYVSELQGPKACLVSCLLTSLYEVGLPNWVTIQSWKLSLRYRPPFPLFE